MRLKNSRNILISKKKLTYLDKKLKANFESEEINVNHAKKTFKNIITRYYLGSPRQLQTVDRGRLCSKAKFKSII